MAPATIAALGDLAALRGIMEEARAMVHSDTLMERPPGYFATVEYAHMYDITPQAAGKQLDRLVRKGKAKKVYALVATTSGTRRQTLYGINK